MASKEYDDESALLADTTNTDTFQFSEKTVRLGFVRKVYAILSAQLLLTIAVISIFAYVEPVKTYTNSPHGQWIWITSLCGVLVFMIVLACCDGARRTWPSNVICLGIFTAFESVMLGAVTSQYDGDAILMAAGITAIVVTGLTIFALQTKAHALRGGGIRYDVVASPELKYDFTACGGILMVLLFSLLGFGIVCMFVQNNYANIAYASMGALLFGMYLVFDTQMMLGGKHRYAISPEEYIFAALNLYLDIINLFLYILSIIQGSRN